MQNQLKENKQKLLHDLAHQQSQLEKEIEKVHQERDVNRTRLLSYIHNGNCLSSAITFFPTQMLRNLVLMTKHYSS